METAKVLGHTDKKQKSKKTTEKIKAQEPVRWDYFLYAYLY